MKKLLNLQVLATLPAIRGNCQAWLGLLVAAMRANNQRRLLFIGGHSELRPAGG
jgi:hypothetical protein